MAEEIFRSGFVAVVGRPNVGKSTLLNTLTGEKVCIVSDRPQTTRNAIQCVLTGKTWQIVFVDTPGLHKPRTKLGEFMMKTADEALSGVDVVLLLLDVTEKIGAGDRHAVETALGARRGGVKVFALLNKTDKVSPEELAAYRAEAETLGDFDELLEISAITGKGTPELKKRIVAALPEGPMYYPEDYLTDQPERFVIAEFIREKTLKYLKDEVPHGVAVGIDRCEEREDGMLEVAATIYCERKSHKGIIIGKNGSMLKKIGTAAREETERLLDTKVYLELWVKPKEDWRDSPSFLKEMGYKL